MRKSFLISNIVLFLISNLIFAQDIVWSVSLVETAPYQPQKAISMTVLENCGFPQKNLGEFSCKIDTEYVKLELDFSLIGQSSDSFLFDFHALIPFNNWREENLILDSLDSVNELLNVDLRYSQIVVENKKNELRFFYEGKYKSNVMYISNSAPIQSATTDYFKEINLNQDNNTKKVFSSQRILKECLRVNDEDECVRLHYIFIPNQNQKDHGYVSRIISSKWIKL